MNRACRLCTAWLFVLAVFWGLAHAEPRPRDRALAASDTAPRPFAVVELFTSEG